MTLETAWASNKKCTLPKNMESKRSLEMSFS